MKKFAVLLIALQSLSGYATEVCLIMPEVRDNTKIACSDNSRGDTKSVNKSITLVLKEKIDEGFKIHSVVKGETLVFTMVKN